MDKGAGVSKASLIAPLKAISADDPLSEMESMVSIQ